MLASKELDNAYPIQVSFTSKNDFFSLKMLSVQHFAQDKSLFNAFWIA